MELLSTIMLADTAVLIAGLSLVAALVTALFSFCIPGRAPRR